MSKSSIFLFCLTLTLASTQAMAGSSAEETEAEGATSEAAADQADFDPAAGEEPYMKECRACHGPTAKGVSSYPKLVDQSAEYLVTMLERYRSGEKIGPNTMLMAPRARKLSDEDIGDVVAFITSLE